MQPIQETNVYMFLYFVIFIVCGVFLCLNVLVGILVQHMLHVASLSDLFHQSKSDSETSVDASDKDRTCNSVRLRRIRL